MDANVAAYTLDQQMIEYRKRRFIAMPIAGCLIWTLCGLAGLFLSDRNAAIFMLAANGCTFYVGWFVSRYTGERFFDSSRPKNRFDALFMQTVLMALMVYAIAIPFFLQDATSLPLTIGILLGLMWIPMSWALGHWVGLFHGIVRTLAVLGVWYGLPELRFAAVPAVIVLVYLVSIAVLEKRYREMAGQGAVVPHALATS